VGIPTTIERFIYGRCIYRTMAATEQVLEDIGLTQNDIKVYMTLLDLGSSLAGQITKKSQINRTCCYDALERLMDKGLVTYVIKANRKYFEAVNPKRLIEILKEKEENVNKILPELEKRFGFSKEKQEATLYKGKKGMKSVAEDVLRSGIKETCVFGAEGNFFEVMEHYAKQWHMKRAKKGINIRIMYNEKTKARRSESMFSRVKMKFISKEYDTPATTWIYGDKTAVIVWSDPIVITVIKSKDVAKSYQNFFEILWKSAKK